jgi:hypothetical protein
VLDLDNIEAGPQVFSMPNSVASIVLDEINDCDGELESICDFDKGRIFLVKHNGKQKLAKEYKAKFLPQTANLIEDGVLDEAQIEELAEKIYDLKKMQPKFDEVEYEKYKEMLLKSAEKLGMSLDSTDSSDEDDDDLVEDDTDESDDDIVDDDTSDEDDDEVDTKKSKASKGKKVEKDEDEDDDFDSDDSDEDDSDFDDDDGDEVEEKKTTKSGKGKVEEKKSSKVQDKKRLVRR